MGPLAFLARLWLKAACLGDLKAAPVPPCEFPLPPGRAQPPGPGVTGGFKSAHRVCRLVSLPHPN